MIDTPIIKPKYVFVGAAEDILTKEELAKAGCIAKPEPPPDGEPQTVAEMTAYLQKKAAGKLETAPVKAVEPKAKAVARPRMVMPNQKLRPKNLPKSEALCPDYKGDLKQREKHIQEHLGRRAKAMADRLAVKKPAPKPAPAPKVMPKPVTKPVIAPRKPSKAAVRPIKATKKGKSGK